MNQTISISSKTVNEIVSRLDNLTREVKTIKARIFSQQPSYGSDAWWEKEIIEAKREIKAGRIKELDNLNQLDKPLDKLFA